MNVSDVVCQQNDRHGFGNSSSIVFAYVPLQDGDAEVHHVNDVRIASTDGTPGVGFIAHDRNVCEVEVAMKELCGGRLISLPKGAHLRFDGGKLRHQMKRSGRLVVQILYIIR